MKPVLLLLSFLALPLHAEIRGAVRGGVFAGAHDEAVGTIELDARFGNWSLAPAIEGIRGGYGLHAYHVDLRRYFNTANNTFWIGAGPTHIATNNPSSETTWNFDAGFAWGRNKAWQPFVAARFYSFHLPVFRDDLEGNGPVISIGVSRRLLR